MLNKYQGIIGLGVQTEKLSERSGQGALREDSCGTLREKIDREVLIQLGTLEEHCGKGGKEPESLTKKLRRECTKGGQQSH